MAAIISDDLVIDFEALVDRLKLEAAANRLAPGAAKAVPPLERAIKLYEDRRLRSAAFAGIEDLFGEPAWDILLYLYISEARERMVSISGACVATDVPGTTALRSLNNLEAQGLIQRTLDGTDARRYFVDLTDRGRQIMDGYLPLV